MIKLNYFCVLLLCFIFHAQAENKPVSLPYADTAPTAPEPSGIKVTTKVDAKSCNFEDVEAVAAKAEPGTQVNIPAGTCDWGLSSLKVGPGVYIKGAGKNQTTIMRNLATDPAAAAKRGPGNYLITFNCAPGKPNTFAHLTLQGSGKGSDKRNGSDERDNGLLLNGWKYVNGVRTDSTCQDFRVFNAKFSGFGFAGITVYGNPTLTRGVIFNNDFIHNFALDPRSQSIILGYGVAVFGDGSWPSMALGTAENTFVENNYMLGNRHHITSNNSARSVFRYNTAITTATTKNHFAIDAHGRGINNGSKTGARQYEIYGNSVNSEEAARTAVGIRGGDGVIFNNTLSPQFRMGVELMVEGASYGFGLLDCKIVPDRITDLYIWNNQLLAPNSASINVVSVCPDIVKLNRDYFLQAKKDYTPFTYPHPLRQ